MRNTPFKNIHGIYYLQVLPGNKEVDHIFRIFLAFVKIFTLDPNV